MKLNIIDNNCQRFSEIFYLLSLISRSRYAYRMPTYASRYTYYACDCIAVAPATANIPATKTCLFARQRLARAKTLYI